MANDIKRLWKLGTLHKSYILLNQEGPWATNGVFYTFWIERDWSGSKHLFKISATLSKILTKNLPIQFSDKQVYCSKVEPLDLVKIVLAPDG